MDRGCNRTVAALTGVYEPEVILGVSVNEEAQIDCDTALARNCLNRRFTLSPKTLVAVGADEPAGWIGQSRAFHRVCMAAGLNAALTVVPGANHLTVLERALAPGDSLNDAVFGLWQSSKS